MFIIINNHLVYFELLIFNYCQNQMWQHHTSDCKLLRQITRKMCWTKAKNLLFVVIFFSILQQQHNFNRFFSTLSSLFLSFFSLFSSKSNPTVPHKPYLHSLKMTGAQWGVRAIRCMQDQAQGKGGWQAVIFNATCRFLLHL